MRVCPCEWGGVREGGGGCEDERMEVDQLGAIGVRQPQLLSEVEIETATWIFSSSFYLLLFSHFKKYYKEQTLF